MRAARRQLLRMGTVPVWHGSHPFFVPLRRRRYNHHWLAKTPMSTSALNMTKHHSIRISSGRSFIDADVALDGSWAAVVGHDASDLALYRDREARLPRAFHFPVIRIVDGARLLVVERRALSADDKNAFLVSIERPWEAKRFHVGDGVQDVLVTANHIVCTYFDEGVFGQTPYASEGVTVFNFLGQFVRGYRSTFAEAGVNISDCYAACHVNHDLIAFTPFAEFSLVCWDLGRGSQSIARLPGELRGAKSMTAHADGFFFHSPHDAPDALFHFQNGKSCKVSSHPERLKSLSGGRFLYLQPEEIVVLAPDGAM